MDGRGCHFPIHQAETFCCATQRVPFSILTVMKSDAVLSREKLARSFVRATVGATALLALFVVTSLERRKLARSAKRREELEKSSWEYEAKRRVEEMKSVP